MSADLPQSFSNVILPLLPPLSLGALLGFAAGYAVKFVGRIALIVAGLLFVAVQLLAYFDLVSVNWLRLETISSPLLQNGPQNAWKWLTGVLTLNLPFSGAFVGGLLLGLRRR
ncbi:FUN14 domain-containing protein [Deinococcus sp.]|uniref:FUN14 domain-containing protein n=1 Tax=Deinococcus sp. TaxID=47478 RepID=UPI003B5AC7AC